NLAAGPRLLPASQSTAAAGAKSGLTAQAGAMLTAGLCLATRHRCRRWRHLSALPGKERGPRKQEPDTVGGRVAPKIRPADTRGGSKSSRPRRPDDGPRSSGGAGRAAEKGRLKTRMAPRAEGEGEGQRAQKAGSSKEEQLDDDEGLAKVARWQKEGKRLVLAVTNTGLQGPVARELQRYHGKESALLAGRL
ncbi:unnamed protein product, partial [Polarella glacialis]